MKNGFIFTTIATLIALFLCCLSLLIPYIGDKALPPLLEELPFESKQLTIHRLSPWKAVGQFELKEKDSSITCSRFELNYSPKQLSQKKINSLLLDSATIILGPELFSSKQGSQTEENSFGHFFDNLSATIDTIILKNTTIILQLDETNSRTLRLNGRVNIFTTVNKENYKIEKISAEILCQGAVHAGIKVTFLNNQEDFTVDANINKLDLQPLQELTPVVISGSVDIISRFVFDKQLKELMNIKTELTSDNLLIKKDEAVFRTADNKKSRLLLEGTLEQLDYSFNGATVNTPQISSSVTAQGKLNPITLDTVSRLTLTGTYSGKPLEIDLQKQNDTFNLEFSVKELKIPEIPNLKHEPIKVSIAGNLQNNSISAKLSVRADQISIPEHNLSLQNMSLKQDFLVEEATLQPSSGRVEIKKIKYNNGTSASIIVNTKLNKNGIRIKSTLRSPYHAKLKLSCQGGFDFDQKSPAKISCTLPQIAVSEKNIPSFIKLPDELTFNANLNAQFDFMFKNKLKGKATVGLSNSTVHFGEKFSLNNINTTLTLPDLPLQHSAPSQILKIDRISAGNIETTNATITYRLENFRTLFIEKGRLNWCGGKVESGGIRISSEVADYNLTLYCDRIGFTELLGQLGMPNAEGQGTLNGRIPISLSDSNLHFDDGFLFSSPGDSGIIRFTNTKTIRDSLGANLEASYLNYSMSALENFEYNWATLSFNSQGDNLTISMRLDGKPATPLPFGYRNGHLVPSETGTGIQHPIHMNVNFHLPLSELFHYGKNIQSLMETM